MSVGFNPKDQLVMNQSLKVQELSVGGAEFSLYEILASPALTISGNTAANPTVVTTTSAHGLSSGQMVVISGSNSTPSLNGTQVVTVLSPTTFSVPVNVSVAGTAGSVLAGSFQLNIREPVNHVYIARLKQDASNIWFEYAQASISIVDSKGGTSGFNEAGVAVSDRGIIQIAGIPALAANDVVVVKYSVLEHL